jgi:hypothetical protein
MIILDFNGKEPPVVEGIFLVIWLLDWGSFSILM